MLKRGSVELSASRDSVRWIRLAAVKTAMPSTVSNEGSSTMASAAAEREAAGEACQPAKVSLVMLRKKIIAPGDCGAHRALPGWTSCMVVAKRSRGRSSRRCNCSGDRTFNRAAASSMARGKPSSRWQMAATAAAFSTVSAKLAFARLRPLDKQRHRGNVLERRRAAAAVPGRGGAAASPRSPVRRGCAAVPGWWPGWSAADRPPEPRQCRMRRPSTCSQLSSTSKSRRSRRERLSVSRSDSPATSRTPSAVAMVGMTRAGSVSGDRSTKETPSG